MPSRRVATAVLGLVLSPAVVAAVEEPLTAHTQRPPKTVIIDNDRLLPSSLEMDAKDSVVFENFGTRPVSITFTEPTDLRDRIRCRLIHGDPQEHNGAPWQLFTWRDGKLVATVPEGRFASLCSLQPGRYTFLVSRLGSDVSPGGGSKPPEKGDITVK